MFADHLEETISTAPPQALDAIMQALCRELAEGRVAEAEAERLFQVIHARRAIASASRRSSGPVPGRLSIFRPRRPQRAREHPERLSRRRRLAASGPLPPQLAAEFTTGELSVLKIVGEEVRKRGTCSRSLAEIAARAGVCRSLAQACIRRAARMGLLDLQERKQAHKPHLPNVLRIVSREWLAWAKLGPQGIGSKKTAPTGKSYEKGKREPADAGKKDPFERRKGETSPPLKESSAQPSPAA